MQERDQMIIEEYLAGRDVAAIVREHGVQERRVYQITRGHKRRRKRKGQEKPPLSGAHKRIGEKVYDFYFDKGDTRRDAANKLGVSLPTMRNIEIGRHRLDLFDLQDIAAFLGIKISELLDER